MVRRSGETEDEEEEKRKLEKAKMEEEEQEVKKLDEMIALREKEQERRRLEEKETEERKAKEEVVAEKEEAKVDEENNSIPVTPVRKVLSRTSSFEVKMTFLLFCTFSLQVIRSKTIILEETNERMERTTMNITQTKVFSPMG